MTNDEIRMTKPANAPLRVFRHSGFGFLSSFVIRHSSLNDLCNSGSSCPVRAERGWRHSLNVVAVLAFLLAVTGVTPIACAATFTASLDRDTIAIGERATLSLRFEGA